ncbi:YggS family pyridoxal phosphate-dependent enzyme [Fulvivirgaceae bacterium BMA12]|uniref:Pyridoxal phosphate homeostasis protein n=1 Tax=Agaribacillus aureus TaxID=3051825 RepID=A0ABT8L070_9BACT|nr:YggS family pyridoxal phosphate-dependent enzyme [Fulvivirgaceae bacterium BMA12]
MTLPIRDNLNDIQKRIKNACMRSNRRFKEVRLLLATKTVSAEDILVALRAGETLIAENTVQELKQKHGPLKTIPHETHFIGHLQSNKIKEVIKYVSCIQSLDRLSTAQKLQNRLEYEDKTMDVFLQINTSYEESKFGIPPENALEFAKQVHEFDRILIKGLMTIGLLSVQAGKVRKCFRLLKDIQQNMLDQGLPVKELSMGMSSDLEMAVEEGATIVRVGTAIFGRRPYPDSYYWNENT